MESIQVHKNFVYRIAYLQNRHSMMRVVQDGQFIIVDSGLPCDTFNIVTSIDFGSDTLQENLSLIRNYIANSQRPFSLWIGPEKITSPYERTLHDYGFTFSDSNLAMWMNLNYFKSSPSLAGFKIQQAGTEEEIKTYAEINAANWSPPDIHVIQFYTMNAEFFMEKSCPIKMYIGYFQGKPICTAELTMTENIAGLYNVCTLEIFRRKGFARTMIEFCLEEARKSGCSSTVLQASLMGISLYEKIGFKPVGEYKEFKLI